MRFFGTRVVVDTHGPEEVLRDVTLEVDEGQTLTLSEWISTVEYRLTKLKADLPTALKVMDAGPFLASKEEAS